MKPAFSAASACAILVALAGSALAQSSAAPGPAANGEPPASAAASPVAVLPIIVREVSGNVRMRPEAGAQLVPVKAGDTLPQAAEILTAHNGIVKFQAGAGQVFTIDRNSRVFIREAVNTGTSEKTRVEMAYGRAGFNVTQVQTKNDVEMKSPDATLAVKGTEGWMEVTPGRPTRAWGGELNTGQFNMLYFNGRGARVIAQGTSSGDLPSPAKNEVKGQFVDIGDSRQRNPDEQEFAENHPTTEAALKDTSAQRALLQYGVGETYFEVSEDGRTVSRFGENSLPFAVSQGVRGIEAEVAGGTFIKNADGSWQLITVENKESSNGAPEPVLRTWRFQGAAGFTPVATFSETGTFGRTSWMLTGLARLGSQFYASGTTYTDFGDPAEVAERGNLFTVGLTNSARPEAVMNLGMDLQGGLAASNPRGTLFAVGSFTGEQFGLSEGRSFTVMEVDPRSNLIVNAASNQTGQLGGSGGVAGPVASIRSVTGLAWIKGQLLITGRNASGEVVRAFYNPGSALLARSELAGSAGGLAIGTASGALRANRTLAPVPKGAEVARDFINPLMADMAYTTAARQSGVVERIVREQILSNAGDRQGCAASGALNMLPGILALHDNTRSGIGLTIAEFRNQVALMNDRSCLPPALYANLAAARPGEGTSPGGNCGCPRTGGGSPN
jgi:hypothetical protein